MDSFCAREGAGVRSERRGGGGRRGAAARTLALLTKEPDAERTDSRRSSAERRRRELPPASNAGVGSSFASTGTTRLAFTFGHATSLCWSGGGGGGVVMVRPAIRVGVLSGLLARARIDCVRWRSRRAPAFFRLRRVAASCDDDSEADVVRSVLRAASEAEASPLFNRAHRSLARSRFICELRRAMVSHCAPACVELSLLRSEGEAARSCASGSARSAAAACGGAAPPARSAEMRRGSCIRCAAGLAKPANGSAIRNNRRTMSLRAVRASSHRALELLCA